MFKFILIFTMMLLPIYLQAEGFRTFKDKQGRKMTAKLTLVSGDDVYIERNDRLKTKVSINIFSIEDQKYIRDWAKEEAVKNGALEIRFTKEASDKNKSASGGIITTTYSAGYGIVLKNTSQEAIRDLRAEYICFKFTDKVAAKKRR